MKNINISVVIPAYKAQSTIIKALESVENQNYKPQEIIVVIDGEQKETEQLVLEFSGQINLILHRFHVNKGPSAARNMGIKLSNYNYIAFLDADDYWEKFILERQVEIIQKYPESSLIAMKSNLGCDFMKVTVKDLLFTNYFKTSYAIINKTTTKIFDCYFNEEIRYSEDYDLWLRICSEVKLCIAYKAESECLIERNNNLINSSGASNRLFLMEKYQLKIYYLLLKNHTINVFQWIIASIYSILKFFRRLVINLIRRKND